MNSPKSEEIKVRVDPLSKRALVQLAEDEQLDLSDIVRRALYQLIERHSQNSRLSTRYYGKGRRN